MATGNLILNANVTGGADGSWSLGPATRLMATAVGAETIVTLAVGPNTITVPAGATNAIIIPPNDAYPQPNPNWGGTLTLKGVTGDTGVPISSFFPTVLPFDATNTPSSFVLTATAIGTLQVKFI